MRQVDRQWCGPYECGNQTHCSTWCGCGCVFIAVRPGHLRCVLLPSVSSLPLDVPGQMSTPVVGGLRRHRSNEHLVGSVSTSGAAALVVVLLWCAGQRVGVGGGRVCAHSWCSLSLTNSQLMPTPPKLERLRLLSDRDNTNQMVSTLAYCGNSQ